LINLLKSHLPGFIKNIDQVRAKGYETVVCVTVNDAFVTSAWAKDRQAEGKVRVLADPQAEFTKAISMEKDLPPLGGVRSKRYTMLVEDNVVKRVFEEPDGTGGSCSLADNVLKNL
jgi:2-Cys peroxiredoxin 5